jgi:hypothetical protein
MDTSRAAKGTEASRKSVKGSNAWQHLCESRQWHREWKWPPLEDAKPAAVGPEDGKSDPIPSQTDNRAGTETDRPAGEQERVNNGTQIATEAATVAENATVTRPALDFRPAIEKLRDMVKPIEHIVEANKMMIQRDTDVIAGKGVEL